MSTFFLRVAAVISLILLYACAGTFSQVDEAYPIPLLQLVEQAPADNNVQSILLFDAILTYGQEGIVQICILLDLDEEQKNLQAEYVLHGLATYVTNNKDGTYRQLYVSGLNQAIVSDLSVPAKKFIISQLQIAGNNDIVPTLSSFLNNDKLSLPAVRALTSIGTASAGEALLNALPKVQSDKQIAIIAALGEIKYYPASGQILPYLDDPNFKIRHTAYFALSNLGYLPVSNKLEQMMQEDQRFLPYYLNFVSIIASHGEVEQATSIYRKIIYDSKRAYSANQKISGLNQLVSIDSSQVINDLFTLSNVKNKKYRMAVLHMAGCLDLSFRIPDWIQLAKDSPPPIQADIISMLGQQKDSTALSYIKESLNSESPEVRLAAIKAYSSALKTDSLTDIFFRLRTALDPDEQYAIRQTIVTYADSLFFNILFDNYKNYPSSAQAMLIQCIIDKKNSTYNSVWIESISAEDSLLSLTAIDGLRIIGDDGSLPHLFYFLDQTTNEKDEQTSIRAISAIINRSENKSDIINSLIDSYDVASVSKKIQLLEIFRGIGGKNVMRKTYDSVSDTDINLSDTAIHSLALWSDENALEPLIDIARNNKNEKYRIIALQGAVRILRESTMDDFRAVQYYEQIMTVANRPEDKRLILSGLANISEPTALKIIIHMMNDGDVEYEAFLAAMKIISADNSKNPEMALVLLESRTQGNMTEKIRDYALTSSGNNNPPEGFIALFNGRDLNGWKGLVGDPTKRAMMTEEELLDAQIEADYQMRNHWKVIDGVLFFDGQGASLCSEKDYSDFEMHVEWKIEKEGDSGIYLRGSPQIQIWDPAQWPEGSGGLYNNQKHPNQPLKAVDHPIGEWNTFRIIMRGEKVTVYLNDVLVVNNVVMENYWERDKPIYPSGQIELQSHHTPLYFRNIYIRELEPEPPLFNGTLFNGEDLSGWQAIGNAEESWHVKEGILYSSGEGGGWLSTTRMFSDFKLSLEFRVPPGGNSGVFLRAPHMGDPAYTGMEIQVLDDYADIYTDLKPWQYTGSVYGLEPPNQFVSKNADQWQSMEITCIGPQVSVILNDIQIIKTNLIDHMSQENTHPGIKRRSGYIGLQNHSTKIEYRNVRLTEF